MMTVIFRRFPSWYKNIREKVLKLPMKRLIEILVIMLCCKASIIHEEKKNTRKHCELKPPRPANEHESCNLTVHTEINDNKHDITHDSECVEVKTGFATKETPGGNEIPTDSSLVVQNESKREVCNMKDKSSKKATMGCFSKIFYRNHKRRNAAETDEDVDEKETPKEFDLATTSNPVKPESIDSQDSTMFKSKIEVLSRTTVDFHAKDSIKHISEERNRFPQAINNSNPTRLAKQHFSESITRCDVTTPNTNVRSTTHNLFFKAENFVQYATMRDTERNIMNEIEEIRIIEKQLENNEFAQDFLFKWHSLLCRKCLIELDATAVKLFIGYPSVYYECVYLPHSLRELIAWYHDSTYRLIKLYESLYRAIQNLRRYQNNLLAFETMLIRINYHYQIVYKEFGLSAKPKQSLDNVISYMFETYTKIRNKHTIYATKGIFDEIRMLVVECTDLLLNHLSICVKIRPYIADLIGSVEFYCYMITLTRFTQFLAETDHFFSNEKDGLFYFYPSYSNKGVMFKDFLNYIEYVNTSLK
ncbi:hypothetical protein THOM_0477 [Trachipleistophora hominis]|uniref:Uncharacterized protein n=1 Tax=Trachipleistophora hominis TaxID=72359 RepID=L7JYY7_TRAHO|nr:hypothetical protein THOM_0477 [Trachipleistophora hominis]